MDFLEGHWSSRTRTFIYATSSSITAVNLTEEVERLASQLRVKSIDFVVWDREHISNRLKEHAKLVLDFFGREWAARFCGKLAVEELGPRLDADEVQQLRARLAKIYRASFGVADSGMIAFRFGSAPAIALRDRFVTPDLILETPQTSASSIDIEGVGGIGVAGELHKADEAQELMSAAVPAFRRAPPRDEGLAMRHVLRLRQHGQPDITSRRPADETIGNQARQVIVGEPGAGKSTLLRYLVLDLLSDDPCWPSVAERWGRHLPVWLPFHFFTQRIEGKTGVEASLTEALRAWLEQYDSGDAWPLVEAALKDRRLLLVVDGLDEWTSDEAGKSALALLQTFADARGTPIVASTRPYGLARLPLSAGWSYARVAPLTPGQQRQLASHYFRAHTDSVGGSASSDAVEGLVDYFLAQVEYESDLRTLSRVPLFLVLLVGLHLSSATQLPSGRFEVYDRAIGLLIAEHPDQRRTAAAVTKAQARLNDRQLRAVLANIAFVTLEKGLFSALPAADLQREFADSLSDSAGLAMEAESAASMADHLLNVAEGELGILVRKGPKDLGFLHRGLQEQLAAEHVAGILTLRDIKVLFEKRIGDPRWSEVLIGVMYLLTRPDELGTLVERIEASVDESLTGIRARELLAGIVFGPCNLPAGEVERASLDIIHAIEMHPYVPHRARLLDTVLAGIQNQPTKNLVHECLKRWALATRNATSFLVQRIASVPRSTVSPEKICQPLLLALCNPVPNVAYTSAVEIAELALGLDDDHSEYRDSLRTLLLQMIRHPQSALTAAASLLSLAIGWRDDPVVKRALDAARTHVEPCIRLIGLADVLGVLGSSVGLHAEHNRDAALIEDSERTWLVDAMLKDVQFDCHDETAIAAVSEAVRGQTAILETIILDLQSETVESRPFYARDVLWPVILRTAPDDSRVIDAVCSALTADEDDSLTMYVRFAARPELADAYGPGSEQHQRVASAIDTRIAKSESVRDIELFELSAISRSSHMKAALLNALRESSEPRWAAEALLRYFSSDIEARHALSATLEGTPGRASKVAGIASRIYDGEESVFHLIGILRELRNADDCADARYDVLISALTRAIEKHRVSLEPQLESLAAEILELISLDHARQNGYSMHEITACLYPSMAARRLVEDLANDDSRPLTPYLRAFGSEPQQMDMLLREASSILNPLPAPLRARICQFLADRREEPQLVMELCSHWADELHGTNKSVASLAYHKALLNARNEGNISDEDWSIAIEQLGHQASASGYGPDHLARRRAAWVGMCVCRNWSSFDQCPETIGEPDPVSGSLADDLYGPDHTLLQQVADCWSELCQEFGDDLVTRLSGVLGCESESQVWDALALVANQSRSLEIELEDQIGEEPELLQLEGVLAWYATRQNRNEDAVSEILVARLGHFSLRGLNVSTILLAEPERIGFQREALITQLEDCFEERSDSGSWRALGALALLDPLSPAVQEYWSIFKRITDESSRITDDELFSFDKTYIAVACQVAQGHEILSHLDRLTSSVEWHLDELLALHIRARLRRDEAVNTEFRSIATDPETSHARAALLMSLISSASGLDPVLQRDAERRLRALEDVVISPFVHDRTLSVTLPVRSVLMRLVDGAS